MLSSKEPNQENPRNRHNIEFRVRGDHLGSPDGKAAPGFVLVKLKTAIRLKSVCPSMYLMLGDTAGEGLEEWRGVGGCQGIGHSWALSQTLKHTHINIVWILS